MFFFAASEAVSIAIQAVLDDPGFGISSPLAANAIQTAKLLQEWSKSEDNKPIFDRFASQLVSELETAFQSFSSGYKSMSVQREKFWGILFAHQPVSEKCGSGYYILFAISLHAQFSINM